MGMKSDQKKSDQLKMKNVTDPDEGTYLQPLLSWTTDLEREPAMGMQLNSPPTKLATPWFQCHKSINHMLRLFS